MKTFRKREYAAAFGKVSDIPIRRIGGAHSGRGRYKNFKEEELKIQRS